MKQFTRSKNYPTETLIGILNLYFGRKKDTDDQGTSLLITLFGIISVSISQNGMIQQTLFRKKDAFFLLDISVEKTKKKTMEKIVEVIIFISKLEQTF